MRRNYLDAVVKRQGLWKEDEKGFVTVERENTGIMNRILQKLAKKPEITYITLDVYGSSLWKLADGNKTIFELAGEMKKKYPAELEPLYDRLVSFIRQMEEQKLCVLSYINKNSTKNYAKEKKIKK